MKSEPKAVRGTQVNGEQGKIFSNLYTPELRYVFDTGAAMGRYLAELKEGRLIARCCRASGSSTMPGG